MGAYTTKHSKSKYMFGTIRSQFNIVIDIHNVIKYEFSTMFKKTLKTCSTFLSNVSVSKITATRVNVYLETFLLFRSIQLECLLIPFHPCVT